MSEEPEIEKETAFTSPIPTLNKIRQLIFGEKAPELTFKIIVYINLCIWLIFQLWHILSYYAITYRSVILEEKKINVEILILNRGTELGFDPSVFMERLINFHIFASLCWLTVFVGIVMMWRQSKRFIYFIFVPAGLYLIGMLLFLRVDYYLKDTTFFDKVIFLLFILNSLFYLLIFRNRKSETDSGFFMEEDH